MRQARLMLGAPAPDAVVYSPDGALVHTSSLWQHGPVVIAFLRHFG